MIPVRWRAWTALTATGLALACSGGSTGGPTGLSPCELALEVRGAGENPILLNETVTVYGTVRQDTRGCIPLADKRVEFGTTDTKIATFVQMTDSSAALTARAVGGTRIVAFLRARRDITLVVPIVVLEESGEPIEDDGIIVD